MDFSTGSLVASLIVSSAGFGLYLYGKREARFPQLIVGLAMMVYPYCVAGPVAMWGIAGALLLGMSIAIRSGL